MLYLFQGVLIFEMVSGYPPFGDKNQLLTYNKILQVDDLINTRKSH